MIAPLSKGLLLGIFLTVSVGPVIFAILLFSATGTQIKFSGSTTII